MVTLAIGAGALLLMLWGLSALAKMNPKVLVARLAQIGGGAAVVVALGLIATGRFMAAIPLLVVASSLLGWLPQPANWTGRTRRSAGQNSRVRTALIEMVLDHDLGEMAGTVVAGPYAGRSLAALGRAELYDLLASADAESRALLEAYLDRRMPGWREDGEPNPAAGAGERRRDGAMTEQEAYEILGLVPGASAEDIRRAHRALMKRLHPDQGGSNWLATRVNEAKDVLLRHHR
ncbi:DnaJ domain-containing protein [Blastochloris viridis]|uniref:DnaJ-like heat shock protein n=1 Tax=Blastochloris viridis TaxID=1079 RepID=A0A0H5BK27_BLAVI|nr:DnaJ domain-containing protein [Blastochloris viridis]ALK09239.1 Chaperone protein DnaJ [Blastochloris viridis]BAS00892.1 DnaJ-like heat shock protein [Blastochloris viridis]CUU41902.1 Preprotein translocase subunit Sec63 [Blastochloris viridis]